MGLFSFQNTPHSQANACRLPHTRLGKRFEILGRAHLKNVAADLLHVRHSTGASGSLLLSSELPYSGTLNVATFLDRKGGSHSVEHLTGMRSQLVRPETGDAFFTLLSSLHLRSITPSTAGAWTSYSAQSSQAREFSVVFRYLLETTLNPQFHESDFLREIHRRDPHRKAHEQRTVGMGVVEAEMRGYQTPEQLLERAALSALFPNSPMRHDVGGVPEAIVRSQLPDLVRYHDYYYVAPNFRFLLSGKSLRGLSQDLDALDRALIAKAAQNPGRNHWPRSPQEASARALHQSRLGSSFVVAELPYSPPHQADICRAVALPGFSDAALMGLDALFSAREHQLHNSSLFPAGSPSFGISTDRGVPVVIAQASGIPVEQAIRTSEFLARVMGSRRLPQKFVTELRELLFLAAEEMVGNPVEVLSEKAAEAEAAGRCPFVAMQEYDQMLGAKRKLTLAQIMKADFLRDLVGCPAVTVVGVGPSITGKRPRSIPYNPTPSLPKIAARFSDQLLGSLLADIQAPTHLPRVRKLKSGIFTHVTRHGFSFLTASTQIPLNFSVPLTAAFVEMKNAALLRGKNIAASLQSARRSPCIGSIELEAHCVAQDRGHVFLHRILEAESGAPVNTSAQFRSFLGRRTQESLRMQDLKRTFRALLHSLRREFIHPHENLSFVTAAASTCGFSDQHSGLRFIEHLVECLTQPEMLRAEFTAMRALENFIHTSAPHIFVSSSAQDLSLLATELQGFKRKELGEYGPVNEFTSMPSEIIEAPVQMSSAAYVIPFESSEIAALPKAAFSIACILFDQIFFSQNLRSQGAYSHPCEFDRDTQEMTFAAGLLPHPIPAFYVFQEAGNWLANQAAIPAAALESLKKVALSQLLPSEEPEECHLETWGSVLESQDPREQYQKDSAAIRLVTTEHLREIGRILHTRQHHARFAAIVPRGWGSKLGSYLQRSCRLRSLEDLFQRV